MLVPYLLALRWTFGHIVVIYATKARCSIPQSAVAQCTMSCGSSESPNPPTQTAISLDNNIFVANVEQCDIVKILIHEQQNYTNSHPKLT